MPSTSWRLKDGIHNSKQRRIARCRVIVVSFRESTTYLDSITRGLQKRKERVDDLPISSTKSDFNPFYNYISRRTIMVLHTFK